jgi:hypothetical protein
MIDPVVVALIEPVVVAALVSGNDTVDVIDAVNDDADGAGHGHDQAGLE